VRKALLLGGKRRGLGRKEGVFCCLGGVFSLKKVGLEVKKENKVRSK
jgi:hypothetical protein